MNDGMCHVGVSQLIKGLSKSVFSARWMSQVQGFGFPKLHSELYGLQEQISVTDFSRMTRPKSEQDLPHCARRSFQR